MKKRAWFCAAGLILLMGAVTGCQGKYQEVAVTDASVETVSYTHLDVYKRQCKDRGYEP